MKIFNAFLLKLLTAGMVLVFFHSFSYAQPIVDGFMKGKGHGSLVLSYSWEQYDQFYLGPDKRDAPPPYGGQITTQSISLYGIVGLTDNLDLVANIPYITAKGEGVDTIDQQVNNLQDASLWLKWRPLQVEAGEGKLSFLAALGLAAPLSDYAANAVLSIGNHSTRIDGRLITHYQSGSGVFAELQAGYSIRSNEVPNATLLAAKLGYAGAGFYIDLWSETQISDSDAPDIGMVPFNETRVNYTQIGLNAFVPLSSSFGISAGVGQYVSGRNVGLATRVSGGIVYSF